MGWIAAAGAVIGAVISSEGAKDAGEDAADAAKVSTDFEKEKYEDWKAVYGDIQRNLGAYYNSLTPESYAAQGLNAFEKENSKAMTTIRERLRQRGLNNSGVAIATELQNALSSAEAKATIRATADEAVAAEQGRFLQIGLGQNPGASFSQVLASNALEARREAAYSKQQAGESIGTAIETVGTALSDYYGNKNKKTGGQA